MSEETEKERSPYPGYPFYKRAPPSLLCQAIVFIFFAFVSIAGVVYMVVTGFIPDLYGWFNYGLNVLIALAFGAQLWMEWRKRKENEHK